MSPSMRETHASFILELWVGGLAALWSASQRGLEQELLMRMRSGIELGCFFKSGDIILLLFERISNGICK